MVGCDYADWWRRISGGVGMYSFGGLESVSGGYQSRWWVNGAGDQNPIYDPCFFSARISHRSMRSSARRQTRPYPNAQAGTVKVSRHRFGPRGSTRWPVAGTPATRQSQKDSGSKAPTMKGTQTPTGVRMRPEEPAWMKWSSQSTARTDGPQCCQVRVSVINRHTRLPGASSCLEKPNGELMINRDVHFDANQ